MSTNDVLKYVEELKQASLDLMLITECLSQVSDLCHRTDINGQDICHLTDLLQKDQRKVSQSIFASSLAIDHHIGPKPPNSPGSKIPLGSNIVTFSTD